jgi:hypothetical protein
MTADLERISTDGEVAKAGRTIPGFRITPSLVVVEMLVGLLWRQFIFGNWFRSWLNLPVLDTDSEIAIVARNRWAYRHRCSPLIRLEICDGKPIFHRLSFCSLGVPRPNLHFQSGHEFPFDDHTICSPTRTHCLMMYMIDVYAGRLSIFVVTVAAFV